MKNYLNTFSTNKNQKNTDTQITLGSDILMASDDVRRIAQRNPALFQTKSVPRLGGFSIGPTGSGGPL